ncbi:ATP-binding cassette domain-containing protein [Arenibaculum pallidiluteum]|uniref:ATP-binding cassette domain-containing protein n=1 Tax=Arenibaculum pallidiluteum TaxID=2812559 RepID=UPI001A96A8FB|nr:ATP-binding cassette domain-containing protein [Arenibaculum pallidiluteum]
MHLLILLRRHAPPSVLWMAAAFVAIAALELGLGLTVTLAADAAPETRWAARDLGVLLLGCLLFYAAQTFLLRRAMDTLVQSLQSAAEAVIHGIGRNAGAGSRSGADKSRADHAAEAVSLLTDPAIPSALAACIVVAVQSFVLVLCGLVYLAAVSKIACILASVILLLIAASRTLGRWGTAAPFEAIRDHQRSAYRTLLSLSSQRRRLALDQGSSGGLKGRLLADIHAIAALHRSTHRDIAQDSTVQQILYFLLLGGLIFMVPLVDPGFQDRMLGAAAVAIFLFGPLSAALNTMPLFDAADVAARQIMDLGREGGLAEARPDDRFMAFAELRLEGIRTDAPEAAGAESAPLDITIGRGRFVAIVGPAGSGKTRLADVLMGLAEPASGRIWVDRAVVGPETRPSLRQLFALAEECGGQGMGVAPAGTAEASALLDLMRLGARERSALRDGIALSAAERMHVEVARSALSDRPIVVLDGILDGADPAWRANFLASVLPRLTSAGRTIVLLTRQPDLARSADLRVDLAREAVPA